MFYEKNNTVLFTSHTILLSSIKVIFAQNFVPNQFLMPVISFVPSEKAKRKH